MFRYLAALAFAISVAALAAPAAAEDPTHEKCTCDLVRENVLNNGASVRNATACWSTEDPDRQWCDITVQAIEGDGRQPAIVSQFIQLQNDPAAVTGFLMDQAQASVLKGDDPADMEYLAQAKQELPALMKENDGLTARCVTMFNASLKNRESFKPFGENGFSCQVGKTTGWLRMTFQVGDIRFVYMVAPNA
jgi:hypothetical protein